MDTSNGRLRDALLELRTACAGIRWDPGRAVRTFLRLRPWLCRSSYLSQHRLRRALEQRVAIEIGTPETCWQQPLRLAWNSLDRTLAQARREVFEEGRFDWNDIRIRLIPKPLSSHG